MELMAVIEGLKVLKEPCEVHLTSDSQYVCNAITKGWAKNWQKNNWIKSDKSKAKNPELWEELLSLLEIHHLTVTWVRGHNGHEKELSGGEARTTNNRMELMAVIEGLKVFSTD